MAKLPVSSALSFFPRMIWLGVVIGASVFHLCAWGRPANVAGEVSFVVVDPVEGVAGWTLTNIGEKLGKVFPAFADLDAARSVDLVFFNVGVVAPTAHGFPSPVERVHFPISGEAVGASYAAAGSGAALLQTFAGSDFDVSAVASATPQGANVDFIYVNWFESDQATESSPCDNYSSGHRAAPIGSRSSGEVGVQASASLRTIASISGGCHRIL